jgi:hypothetical protein
MKTFSSVLSLRYINCTCAVFIFQAPPPLLIPPRLAASLTAADVFAILTRSVNKKCSFVWNKIRLQNNTRDLNLLVSRLQKARICRAEWLACTHFSVEIFRENGNGGGEESATFCQYSLRVCRARVLCSTFSLADAHHAPIIYGWILIRRAITDAET